MDRYIKRINFFIENSNLTLILCGTELVVFCLAFLIAIPTDYGRIFAISSTAFFISLYTYCLLYRAFLWILFTLESYYETARKLQSASNAKYSKDDKLNKHIFKALKIFMSEDELKLAKLVIETNNTLNRVLKIYLLDKNKRNYIDNIINFDSRE